MYDALLGDARLYRLLQGFDEDLAAKARARGCVVCRGVLHGARYPRKPRGGATELGPEYDKRLSFCCAVRGCRKRVTPASVRFLGRKVYLGAVVVLVSAMRLGATPRRVSQLRALVGVSARTLERWRAWWRRTFAESAFWRAATGWFDRPVARERLPQSLLERFACSSSDQVVATLRFLAPITTATAAGGAAL